MHPDRKQQSQHSGHAVLTRMRCASIDTHHALTCICSSPNSLARRDLSVQHANVRELHGVKIWTWQRTTRAAANHTNMQWRSPATVCLQLAYRKQPISALCIKVVTHTCPSDTCRAWVNLRPAAAAGAAAPGSAPPSPGANAAPPVRPPHHHRHLLLHPAAAAAALCGHRRGCSARPC